MRIDRLTIPNGVTGNTADFGSAIVGSIPASGTKISRRTAVVMTDSLKI